MSRITIPGWRLVPPLLAALLLGFHGLTNLQQALEQPSAGWSRPLLAGATEFQGATVPAQLDSGETMLLSATARGIDFSRLASDGTLLQRGALPLPDADYQAISAVGGSVVHLFWTSDVTGPGTLFHAVITADGALERLPSPIAGQVLGYKARGGPAGPVVMLYGPDGLGLHALTPGGWTRVGDALQPQGSFGSLDGQVLADGGLAAILHVNQEGFGQKLYLLRGTLDEGFTDGYTVHHFGLGEVSGRVIRQVQPVALGVDLTHAYAFYAIETVDRGAREVELHAMAGPLAPGRIWTEIPLNASQASTAAIQAGQPVAAVTAPGQAESLKVLLQAETASRYARGNGLLLGRFQDGQLRQIEVAAHGKNAFQPNLAPGPAGDVISFVTFTGGKGYRQFLIASVPAFIERQEAMTAADLTQALLDTLFDLMAMIYPLIQGLMWLIPMLAVIGLLHLLALNWTERHPVRVFWLGVLIALPLQLKIGADALRSDTYTHAMPAWLAAGLMPALIYFGIGTLMLLTVLRLRPPTRYTGALVSLTWWGLGTVMMTALLFGPFVRR